MSLRIVDEILRSRTMTIGVIDCGHVVLNSVQSSRVEIGCVGIAERVKSRPKSFGVVKNKIGEGQRERRSRGVRFRICLWAVSKFRWKETGSFAATNLYNGMAPGPRFELSGGARTTLLVKYFTRISPLSLIDARFKLTG